MEEETVLHSFSSALISLKCGDKIARVGWNGKGMWLILVDSNEYSIESYKKFDSEKLLPFIAMRTADKGLVPWSANYADILAEDWVIVK